MRLSVTISAYDRHELTALHVKGCMDSTRIPDEIIVVNDGGDSSLKEMLKRIDKKCPLIYARIKEDIPWNQVGARNLGIWISRGDFIAIEDNDHIPHKDFYEAGLKICLDNDLDYLLSSKRILIKFEDLLKNPIENCPPIKSNKPHHAMVGIYKRDLLMKLKGFNESFAGRYGFDVTDWVRRIRYLNGRYGQNGYYYVVEGGESKTFPRVKYGKYFKMDYINYKKMAKSIEEVCSINPILNFSYEYEVL